MSSKMNVKNYIAEERLDDGSPVIVRAIRPDDKDALQKAFSGLSSESRYARFFRLKESISSGELDYYTQVDFVNHVAIGVGLLEDGQMVPIGIGRYVVDSGDPGRAELALTVDDMYQGIGVGSLMLKHLAVIAKHGGIEELQAAVLESNERMLHLLNRSRLEKSESHEPGVVHVVLKV